MPDSANDNQHPSADSAAAAAGKCALCGKPRDAKYRPFCSKHCADVDLARWLGGRYAIPTRPDEDDEDSPGADENA